MYETLGCLLVDASPSNVRARPLASRSLAGKPLVDWVLRRASEAQQLQRIVVILPSDAGLEWLRRTLPSGVSIFQSQQHDALARMCDCLSEHPARGVVNLRLDCPLLDPCLIDRLVSSVSREEGVDYATYRSQSRRGESRLLSLLHAQLGLFAEYFRADVLRRLNQELTTSEQRQNLSAYLCARPERFVLRLVTLPPELDRTDLRLSLRHQDDWEHAEQIVEALGDDELDWQHIVSLLSCQPHLRRRMADLNQADLEASVSR
jgi:spore coat polysaccharide biosynthesis protein SpsF (cytidylyltransferase family)